MYTNKLYNGLPVFEARINEGDDSGVYCVSLVTNPATEIGFVYFAENKQLQKFAVADKSEHMVSGIIMVANTPIFRIDGEGKGFYIVYSKDTLKYMAEKMVLAGVGSSVNIQHEDGSNVDGVNLAELYIIDREKGIDPEYFSDAPDGSLVGTYKVRNDDVWEMIENGDVLSFSLEGLFDIQPTFEEFNKVKKNTDMSKIKKFFTDLMKFEEIETSNGKLYWGEGELEVGKEVFIEQDGEKVAASDGEYLAEDKVIVISEGKVSEIRIKEEAPVVEEEEVIEVNASKQRFEKVKAAFEESYEDKERKIIEAIRAKGFDCWLVEAGDDYAIVEIWVDETADYKHYRFGVTWDEEGNCSVSDPEEVKSEFVPVDEVPAEEPKAEEEVVVEQFEDETIVEVEPEPEPQPEERDEKEERIAKLEEDLAALKQELADLKASVAEYVQKPAAEPIVEEFSKAVEANTNGLTRKQSKAVSLASYLKK